MSETLFQPISLKEECPQLSYEFSVSKFSDHLIDTLVISFKGKYRDGAAGRPDAGLMKGIVETGLAVWDPFSVLIDLRELEYSWGDNIDSVFASIVRYSSAVLVSYKNRRGLSTLEFGTGTRKDIVDNDFFFDNFEAAIKKIKRNK